MIDWAHAQRECRPSRPWAGQWWQEWDEHLHRYGIANEPGGFDDDLIGFVLARIAEEDRAAVVAARPRKFTWRFEHDSQEVTDMERDTRCYRTYVLLPMLHRTTWPQPSPPQT